MNQPNIVLPVLDSRREEKIDCTYINQQVQVVLSELRIFDTILTQCRNIKKSNDEIQKSIESTRENIEEELNKIIKLLELKSSEA